MGGVWKYRKIGPSSIREICVLCHKNLQKKAKKNPLIYQPLCSQCDKRRTAENTGRVYHRTKGTKFAYRKHKKEYCESCGFESEFSCQFDVDHIDGDHSNNALENLQTLCANCHRLKTYLNRDWENKKGSI